MKSVYPLIILCSVMLLCRICWYTYQLAKDKLDDVPNNCLCTCTDKKIFAHDLLTTVHYKGPKMKEKTCSCEDFFEPKIKNFVDTPDGDSLCEVCKCYDDKNSGSEFLMSYQNLVDVIIVTVICVTLLLLFNSWLEILNEEMYRQHSVDRREARLIRGVRGVKEYLAENTEKMKELLKYPLNVRVNIHDCPNETPPYRGYQTFPEERQA